MSTLKKVISLVLCAAILVGSFALAGNIAPAASAAENASKIDSYADLVAKYGQDGNNFVYTGLEFYEADGTLTDYYVKSGDELTARIYVKSNLYIGEAYFHSLYDNAFFDVKLAGGPNATTVATGYTSNYTGGTINAKHPIKVNNGAGHTITSINLANVGWVKSLCGFTAEYLAATDLVKSNTKTDITVSSDAYDATSDEWLFEYYVKVKDGLADGVKGTVTSPLTLWHASINSATNKHDQRKQSYIPVLDPAKQAAGKIKLTDTSTMAAAMDSGVLDTFLSEDLEHEFTIGAPSGGGSTEVTEYTATFYAENETDVVATSKVEAGKNVEFPAPVENQIGWAIVKEAMSAPGKILENGAEYTVNSNVEFLRVLSTSKFPVEIKASEFTVDAEKVKEAGAEYDADKAVIRIMLAIGETFDLASITDAISKAGNEFAEWNVTATAPSTVEGTVITLNTVNGALGSDVTLSANATWTAEIYTVNFYADKDATEPLKTTEVEYNKTTRYSEITNAKADKKFAGWYNAANDELISTSNTYLFTVTGDLNVYAAWSSFKNEATFMVRDYVNGKWVEIDKVIDKSEGETATVGKDKVNSILKAACADTSLTFMGIYTANPDENAESKVNGILQLAPGNYMTADLTFSGHQTYYIATTLACDVTWKIPAYDADTNTFDEANATVAFEDKIATAAYATDSADPYAAASKFNKTVEVPTGYALAYWKDATTGEKVEFNANGAYVVNATAKSATLIAVFELVEYKVAFNLRNSASPDLLMMTETVTLGEEIVIDGADFTLNGKATVLPEVGLKNAEQADGGYTLLDGHKFAGWTFGTDSNAAALEFPVKLTTDIIKRNFANGVLNINALWEAEEFTITFYITNANGEEEVYDTKTVKVGEEIAKYRNVTAEIAAAINAKAPLGKVFSNIWYNKETNAPDTSLTKMPAKNLEYYAQYNSATISVYVDYNYLAEKNLEETMSIFRLDGKELLLYGADITEVKSEAPYYERSFKDVVTRAIITTTPEDPSEIIAWNIYHVAAGEDPYTAEWKEGVNDEGTTIAQTTLIFQPVWKAHKDMLVRFHDTDDNIYFAIGKDFSFHYWNTGVIVDKYSDTVINTNPEEDIVLFFTIEEFDLKNFSFRLDAFPIPKYIFTPDGFIAFFQMIPELIKSLLG